MLTVPIGNRCFLIDRFSSIIDDTDNLCQSIITEKTRAIDCHRSSIPSIVQALVNTIQLYVFNFTV